MKVKQKHKQAQEFKRHTQHLMIGSVANFANAKIGHSDSKTNTKVKCSEGSGIETDQAG